MDGGTTATVTTTSTVDDDDEEGLLLLDLYEGFGKEGQVDVSVWECVDFGGDAGWLSV